MSPKQNIADTSGLAVPLAAFIKNLFLSDVALWLILEYKELSFGLLVTYDSTVWRRYDTA